MKEEYFWSIVVEQDLVQASLWAVRNENVAIISTSEAKKWETDGDLVEKSDQALSEAIVNFPEDAKEPDKVVFGVPSSWVEDGRIQKPHLEKLRLVTQKLSLTASGFVVLPEAIAHSVKIKEGSPLTGVVIGVGAGSIDMTMFRLGNIVGTVNVGRSNSVIEDVMEGLSRLSGDQNVPTRWLLYDGTDVDLEEVKQELIAADWKDSGSPLKFLHTPQIEVVSVKEKAEAVSIAGASEMGNVVGVEGFVAGKDFGDSNISSTHDLKPQDLGFVIDQDIAEPEAVGATGAGSNLQQEQMSGPSSINNNIFSKLAFLGGVLKNVKTFTSKKAQASAVTPPVKHKRKYKIALIVLPALIAAGFVVAWYFLPKADVVIVVSPKNLNENETIVLDTEITSPDVANMLFPVQKISVDVSGERTKGTTGTKTVGERARGVVVIRNGTSSEEDFKAGSILATGSGLKYEIDKAVTVPEAQSPTTPGTVSVEATAVEFGADYNIAEDESLSVANYPKSEIDAVVSEAFSGGSSRQIQAVSSSDRDSLKKDLEAELRSQAISQLEGMVQNARFIRDTVSVKINSEDFSAASGEEADSLSLTMSVTASGLVLPEDQVKELAKLILDEQVPDGYTLRSEQIKSEFDLVDEIDDGRWEFDINLSANLLPNVDIDKIKNDIAGKQSSSLDEYFSKSAGFVRYSVTIAPRFPSFFGNIPRRLENISIEIASE